MAQRFPPTGRLCSVFGQRIPYEPVRRYIARQKQHRKRMSFRDELLHLLEKHRVQYDERYLWD